LIPGINWVAPSFNLRYIWFRLNHWLSQKPYENFFKYWLITQYMLEGIVQLPRQFYDEPAIAQFPRQLHNCLGNWKRSLRIHQNQLLLGVKVLYKINNILAKCSTLRVFMEFFCKKIAKIKFYYKISKKKFRKMSVIFFLNI
jgi:hypothetical protein